MLANVCVFFFVFVYFLEIVSINVTYQRMGQAMLDTVILSRYFGYWEYCDRPEGRCKIC